jgi:hypothetical protein
VVLAFLLLFFGKEIELPANQSLPFVGTLVGSITGFCFGGGLNGLVSLDLQRLRAD